MNEPAIESNFIAPARTLNGSFGRERSPNILGRAFGILELFSLDQMTIRIEDLVERLGFARSTAYRYIGELCDAGLLSPVIGGAYMLGPRIIELERLLELSDPLHIAASRTLPLLARDDEVLLVKSLFRDKVICIHKIGPETIEYGGRQHPVHCERGQPISMFGGAGSLVLLAALSPARARDVYRRHSDEIGERGLGGSWEAFRARLQMIRRKGHAVGRRREAPMLASIAVPVRLLAERRVVGSLVDVFASERLDPSIQRERIERLQAGAARIADEFVNQGADRRPAPSATNSGPVRLEMQAGFGAADALDQPDPLEHA
ncbi:MAG: IclR family transcriptional regulator [Lautropia sp.]